VDAWHDRCDQEEHRELISFHKPLRQLNITNTSWLQAFAETLREANESSHASDLCNLQSAI
jgi:hypothetical protein